MIHFQSSKMKLFLVENLRRRMITNCVGETKLYKYLRLICSNEVCLVKFLNKERPTLRSQMVVVGPVTGGDLRASRISEIPEFIMPHKRLLCQNHIYSAHDIWMMVPLIWIYRVAVPCFPWQNN